VSAVCEADHNTKVAGPPRSGPLAMVNRDVERTPSRLEVPAIHRWMSQIKERRRPLGASLGSTLPASGANMQELMLRQQRV